MSNNSIESSVASHPLQGSENIGSTKTLTQIIKAPIAFLHEHLFSISVISILLYGWSRRDDNYLSAENGAGYILGIVGGSLLSAEVQGRRCAEVAARIMSGVSPKDVHPERVLNHLMFDWHQLKRWKIPEDRLPPAASFGLKPPHSGTSTAGTS